MSPIIIVDVSWSIHSNDCYKRGPNDLLAARRYHKHKSNAKWPKVKLVSRYLLMKQNVFKWFNVQLNDWCSPLASSFLFKNNCGCCFSSTRLLIYWHRLNVVSRWPPIYLFIISTTTKNRRAPWMNLISFRGRKRGKKLTPYTCKMIEPLPLATTCHCLCWQRDIGQLLAWQISAIGQVCLLDFSSLA